MTARSRIGVDLGGTNMIAVVTDGEHEWVYEAPTGASFSPADLRAQLERIGASLDGAPEFVGVAVPGLVGPDGAVEVADVLPAFTGWAPDDLAWLRCDVVVRNDVDAVLVELLRRQPELRDAAVVMAGTGIGSSFLAGGRLVRGSRGWAGELGFTIVRTAPNAMTLDECSSGFAVLRRLGRTVDEVVDAVAARDEAVVAELHEAGTMLGVALANVIDLLNPARLFLGGGMLRYEPYRDAALASVQRYALPPSLASCGIEVIHDDRTISARGASRDRSSHELRPAAV